MKKTVFIIIILVTSITINAQNKSEYKKIEKLTEKGNYKEALPIMKSLYRSNPESGHYNFKLGYLYYLLENDSAVIFLEKASNKVSKDFTNKYNDNRAPLEAWFYLGLIYHSNYKFEKALSTFENLNLFITDGPMKTLVDKKIRTCKNGIEIMEDPVSVEVFELGGGINSLYADHSPVFAGNMNTMIFTSKRKGINDVMDENGDYSEDIFVSYHDKGTWSPAVSISNNINTPEHEASIGLSIDGTKLYIYKSNNNGDIFFSDLKNGSWSVPQALGSNINTKDRETHATLSVNGKELYFTSDRKGGYGGTDIYIAHLQKDGSWGDVKNLGPTINTPSDEEGPFIHPDDSTLFFSSKGHKGIGGFDLFISMKAPDGNWFPPSNIGYPINSSDDDLFLSISPSGKFAFYVSNQLGTSGNTNIYGMRLPSNYSRNVSIFSGKVQSEDQQTYIPNKIIVEIIDPETKDTIRSSILDSHNGEFTSVIPSNKPYIVSYKAENQLPLISNVIGSETKLTDLDITLQPISPGISNQSYKLYYKGNSNKINYQSEITINQVSQSLNKNKQLRAEIVIPKGVSFKQVKIDAIIAQFTKNNIDVSNIFLNESDRNISFEILLADTVFIEKQKRNWQIRFDEDSEDLEIISIHKLKEMVHFMKMNKDLYVEIPFNGDSGNKNLHTLFHFLVSEGIDTSRIRAKRNNEMDSNDFSINLEYKETNNEYLSIMLDLENPHKSSDSSEEEDVIEANKAKITNNFYESKENANTIEEAEVNDVTINNAKIYDPCEYLYEKANSVIFSINFEYNKDKTKYISGLDTISDCLIINPNIKMELGGHTDAKGKNKYNTELGKKRAVYIYTYMLEKGVNPTQLETKTYGENTPIAPNSNSGKDNPKGREKNRRVDLRIKIK